AGKFKDTVKYLMVPGIIFEELGFTYIGPVNGHDLAELKAVLNNVKRMKGPILLHTITQKGKGYEPALQKPDIFHGVGPFDIDTGTQLKKSLKTYTEIFGDFMLNRGRWDNKLVAISAAMTSGTGLSEFSRQFPERFFDVGICEQHAVTLAAGMASAGLRPVVAAYSTFLQRAYDQIVHDVALQKLPVVFAIDRAGMVGEDGPTHHGAFDFSYLRHIPNLTIMAPADENELLDMLHSAFCIGGPVAVRYPRGVGEGVRIRSERQLLEPGQSRLILEGQDLAIIAVGRGVSIARDVVDILAGKGVNPLLVDARFVKPLDHRVIAGAARKHHRLVTIEDNCRAGGFGSAIGEMLVEEGINAEFLNIAIPDEFVEHGRVELLFEQLNMNPDSIVESIASKWPELFSSGARWELLKFGQN
ncbi:MAG: 1-deoxy-D-xylulose-5-phosphate synthase, partial [Syntrophomonas sp.]|nr:1-deoxy-D-xylulose-5-phosphate synthase [Syntrophomonas sp.]